MRKRGEKSLGKLMISDIFQHAKLPFLLLLLIIVTAFSILLVTNKTRLLRNEHEQLMIEKDALDNEWRKLILEENVLAKYTRIEKIATERLSMHKVAIRDETIIKIKRIK